MTGDDRPPRSVRPDDETARSLRLLAEDRLRAEATTPVTKVGTTLSPDDPARIVHELRVHQIELEMQNEELRRAQVELDASRARWMDLYEFAPVGYCTVTEGGLIGEANLTLTTMLGTPRSGLVRRPFSRLILADDQDIWYLTHRKLKAHGSPQSCEVRLVTAEEQPRSVQLTLTAAMDERGTWDLRIAVTDISVRKQAERQAQSSRELLDAIVDSTPSHIFAVNREQRLTLVNAAMAHQHGTTKSDMLGKTIGDFFEPETAAAMQTVYDRIMRTGVMESQEQELRSKGDRVSRVVHAAQSPLRDADGVVIGLSAVFTDLTYHRQAEVERTSLVAQLQQAQKMESIGRLAGGVAHDFNNQLGVILGHAELVLTRLDVSHPAHQDIVEIRDAAMRSAALTRQLLAFARRQAIHLSMLDLNRTVAHALIMLRRLIGENIELLWRPGAVLWPVTMDEAQVEQILANLMVNAKDAIAGQGTITVSTVNRSLDLTWCATRADAAPGDYVMVTVTDDGCGMPAEVLAQIFEPFFTTKGVGEGTGLGLASVYGAVRQNGGFVTVDSVVGQGTTFRLFFQRRADVSADVSARSLAILPLARGHETILLVEDEAAVRRLTCRVLEAQGYTVLAAESPRQAILLARAHGDAIALLLSDVVMPGMEGPALADLLAADHPHLRHLLMSGYSVHEAAAPQSDGAHFIAKPFTVAAFTAKVREVLDRA